ncbi:MAG: DUF11 domain-containing protein, partial [Acidobacteria bacterium]|nr:DUF11 domain-containing protein [Acidobacteriota bacterium]
DEPAILDYNTESKPDDRYAATPFASADHDPVLIGLALASSANLSVTKTDGPDPIVAGNNLTYTITVTNSGPDPAATVVLNDTLPAGTTFVSLTAPSGWSCTTPAVGATGTVSCSNASFAVGSAAFTLVVNVGLSAANSTLSNTATATSTTTDPAPGNESGTATTTVTCPLITITQATLPSGQFGVMYNQTLTGSGGTAAYSFALAMGSSLPAGLNLSTAGVISGTPTGAGATTFTVNVTDAKGCPGNRTFTVGIQCPTINIAPATLPNPQSGVMYSQTLTGSGGVGPYTFALQAGTSLPPGLNLVNGVITGVPTTIVQTSFTFTINVTDTGLSAGATPCGGNRTYTVSVGCATITVNPASLPPGVTNNAYSATFSATGGNGAITFARTSGSFPAGLTLTGAMLSGTPTASGKFDFTITATDVNGCTGSRAYTLVIDSLTARLIDPLVCLGPGGLVTGEVTLSNPGAIAQNATITTTLPSGLVTLPNSCVVNTGACTIPNGSTVSWMGTLNAGQTLTLTYQAQLGDVPSGTELCALTTAFVDGAGPFTVRPCTRVTCTPIGPGTPPPAISPVSDQKAGSVLFYNLIASDASNTSRQNARISITNIEPTQRAYVHLFFVDGASCAVADSFICLTPNQTATVLASDIDPGTTGYLIAVATNAAGCPISFNYLIGDEFVKLASGHAANLGAEAIAAIAGGFIACDPTASTAVLSFNDVQYNALPRTLAASNIGSPADGNSTLLVVNRLGGSLLSGAATVNAMFGLLYDDAEKGVSFSFTPNSCQFRSVLTDTFPRTTPRLSAAISSGRTGWIRLSFLIDGGGFGATLNLNNNVNAGAFNGGHNLHKLTLSTAASVTVPVFPPGC